MTALMGSSGAGKTTLMDVLASRKTTGRITGAVMVNGHVKDEITFSRIIGSAPTSLSLRPSVPMMISMYLTDALD